VAVQYRVFQGERGKTTAGERRTKPVLRGSPGRRDRAATGTGRGDTAAYMQEWMRSVEPPWGCSVGERGSSGTGRAQRCRCLPPGPFGGEAVKQGPPLFERVAAPTGGRNVAWQPSRVRGQSSGAAVSAAARTGPRAAAQTGIHVRPLVRKPVVDWTPRRHRLGGVCGGAAVDDGGVGRMARSTERPYRLQPWAQQRGADGTEVRDDSYDSAREQGARARCSWPQIHGGEREAGRGSARRACG
jgi:hypothetical protein